MKLLDKHIGSAVFVGQVASKPRVKERNRTEMAVFLRPTDERLSGGQGYTTPFGEILAPFSFTVSNHPAPSKVPPSKKKERHTMFDFSRPVDVLDECAYRIAFLEEFFTQPIAVNETPYLSNSGAQGLSLFLCDIKTALTTTSDVLSQRLTVEVRS